MSFRDLLTGTFRTLWVHKLRTFLTMFGIAWGIVSIMLMVASGEGLRVGQQKAADQFGKDIIIFFTGRTSMQAGGTRAGRVTSWMDTDFAVIQKEATACAEVLPDLGAGANVRSPFNSATLHVTGSLPAFAWIRTIPVGEGRFYNDADNQAGRRVAFLGDDAKKQLFATRSAIGETISVGGFPYTVIGVMQHKEQDSSYDGRDISKVFIPFTSVMRDFPQAPPELPHSVPRILVTPKSLDRHEECKWQVRRALGRLHDFDPRDEEAAKVWDTAETTQAFHTMTEGMKYFLGAVGIVSLLLGGIGVMNVMLVAVRERTREIGVRKAVGATAHEILREFFVETAIIVFFSGFVGMSVAFGICALVNSFPMPQYFAGLLATWDTGLLAVALLGVIAVLSALYPARCAASVDPIEALRYEAGG
ncbi:MAG: ABC transporter permease [Bryobacteraceae bacterium]